MDRFAIQRIMDGAYVAPTPDTLVRDPHQARIWHDRQGADLFLDNHQLRDSFRIARLPSFERGLLTEHPVNRRTAACAAA